MKSLFKILTLTCCCIYPSLIGAQVIGITEITRGDSIEIDRHGKQLVDINSRLTLTLSKEKLITAIESQFPQFAKPFQLDRQISSLGEALADQETILALLDNQVQNISNQEEFFALMDNFLTLVIEGDEALSNRHQALAVEFFAADAQTDGMSLEAYIFDNLSSDLNLLEEELAHLEADVYTISLVAYKRDRQGGDRVHIENFDTYTEKEFVTIPRWVNTLDDDQKKQLEQLAEKAEANNQKTLSIFESLKTWFLDNFPSVNCLKQQRNEIKAFINDPAVTDQLTQTAQSVVSKLLRELEVYITLVDLFKTNVADWTITTPFTMGDQFSKVVKQLRAFQLNVDIFKTEIASISALAARVETLASDVHSCLQTLEADLKKLADSWYLLTSHQKKYIQNKALGKEVLKFAFDDLPKKGHINLKGTGSRVNGDELMVELFLRRPMNGQDLPEKSYRLEERTLVMQLIGARSEVAVGMIMANPQNRSSLDFNLDRKFYFAPSASLLLKFGSRNSYFYNEFIDIGVGLNFASPDFNTDGSPEFGTGLILTAFKDILSVGYNYNVSLDATYWFFGVNLPFNLPGLPVNSIK